MHRRHRNARSDECSARRCNGNSARPFSDVGPPLFEPRRRRTRRLHWRGERPIANIRATSPSTRILLAGGYTADTNVAALLRDHAIPLLSKPYDPDRLLRALRSELDPTRA